MAKKNKKDKADPKLDKTKVKPSLPLADGLDKLASYLAEKAAKTSDFSACRMSQEYLTWRYADFYDPKMNRPCLPLEWLFGTRGLIGGRVLNITGLEHDGKSSFVHLLQAGHMAAGGVYPILVESEEASLVPDRIKDIGIEPHRVIKIAPAGVIECLKEVEATVFDIRRMMDPEKKYPISISVDSISGLGNTGIDPETGEILSGDCSTAVHSRKFSDFFRNRLKIFRAQDAVLVFTSQIKTDIPMAGSFQRASETHIAEGTFKYHNTWKIRLKKMKDTEAVKTGEPRNMVIFSMQKNKIAGAAQNRNITVFLYETERCWDFTKATTDLFNGIYSPFDMGDYKSGGGWYSHVAIKGGKSMHQEEFVNAFYENEELLMKCREILKIRGFGFDFEKTEPIEPIGGDNDNRT